MDHSTNNNFPVDIAKIYDLIGQPFCYGIKSPDMDLYDIGFGVLEKVMDIRGRTREVCTHTLHCTCGIKLIWAKQSYLFDGESSFKTFSERISRFVGLKVLRIALSQKNDLWIDLGECKIVIVTNEDYEESWRYFNPCVQERHLVASSQSISLQ